MNVQLSFFQTQQIWMYNRGLPNREGIYAYTHLIMWHGDPEETLGRGFSNGKAVGRKLDHWKAKNIKSVKEFKDDILKLLSDGEPRTFNHICVVLTGTNANVWLDKAPDIALWQLVEEELIAWCSTEGATFFIDSNFVNWDST